MSSHLLYCQAQSNQEIDNLISFAKAYGYVKYFHPSTEADHVDWGWFSVYASEEVLKCRNNEELMQTMQRIFEPIAPTVSFTLAEPSSQYPINATPENKQGYLSVYWQHFGISKDMNQGNPLYRSVRVNSPQPAGGNETLANENQESPANNNNKMGNMTDPSFME